MSNIIAAQNTTAESASEIEESVSEIEACVILGKCPRTLLIWRKAGKMPPHFMKGIQVRYLSANIQALKPNKQ